MRFGFIAIIGAPNAGKSTLVNQLVGQKVAIVTHKAQTTRARLRAILLHQQSQIVLVDTPGIFEGSQKLDQAMVKEAWHSAEEADAIVVMIDVSAPLSVETELILDKMKQIKKPVFLILNKVDKVKREILLKITKELNEKVHFQSSFMISALKKTGFEELIDTLAQVIPAGHWHYPEDVVVDIPSMILAAEITREKLFLRFHQELPYSLTVESERWLRQKNGSVKIEQVIYVRRSGQKAIILGKGGQSIKEIGMLARQEMEESFGHKVHLFLFVKVRENWMNDPERYRMMGIHNLKK